MVSKLKGTLSAAAANRIGHPELAGIEVEYNILRPGLSGEVYYQGEFLIACVGIGPNGIMPIQEEIKENADEN